MTKSALTSAVACDLGSTYTREKKMIEKTYKEKPKINHILCCSLQVHFFRYIYCTNKDSCSISEPMQQKPHTVGRHGVENYRTQVFVNSDHIIKGAILNVPNES